LRAKKKKGVGLLMDDRSGPEKKATSSKRGKDGKKKVNQLRTLTHGPRNFRDKPFNKNHEEGGKRVVKEEGN